MGVKGSVEERRGGWLDEWSSLTFTLLAISLVARFADAVVGLGCVLAEGVDVAVVRTLGTLVCICTDIGH